MRLLAGLAGLPALAQRKLSNWAGNLTYSTDRLTEAATVDAVGEAVREHPRLKVQGTRHCFNRIADSGDALLSLKPMQRLIGIDPAAKTATVEAGMTYGQLCPLLDAQGWALHNLASLPHISIAGACATATHGSGERNGNLATAVTALEMVAASGEVIRLSRARDAEVFPGAVAALGALGVVTRVTLDLQPKYTLRQYVYLDMPLDQALQRFDEIQASGYSVSLFTSWRNERVDEVWIKSRGGSFRAPREWLGARLAERNMHPIAALDAANCTEQMGKPGPWYDRLPHFRMGFTPSAGKELQSEYFVPRRHAAEAILAIERLRDRIPPHLMISEIRTIAADALWMSTCYQRDSVAIHFTWKPEGAAVHQLLPVIERELGPFEPRPHWGKLFAMDRAALLKRYERLPDFIRLAGRFDPQGKFRNAFLAERIFGA